MGLTVGTLRAILPQISYSRRYLNKLKLLLHGTLSLVQSTLETKVYIENYVYTYTPPLFTGDLSHSVKGKV